MEKNSKSREYVDVEERQFGKFKSSRDINYEELKELPEKEALIKLGSKRGSMLKSKDIPINPIKKEQLPEARLEVQKLYATMYETTLQEAETWYNRQVKTGKELKEKGIKIFSKEDVLLQFYKANLINAMRKDEAIHVTMVNERGGKNINTSLYEELEYELAEKNKYGAPILTPKIPMRNKFRIHTAVDSKSSMELSKGNFTEVTASKMVVAAIRQTAPEYIDVRVEQAKLNYIKAFNSYLAHNVDVLPRTKVKEVERYIMGLDKYKFEDLWNSVPIEHYRLEQMVDYTNSVLIELSEVTGIEFNL